MNKEKALAIVVGLLTGLIGTLAIVVGIFSLTGKISVEKANIILMAFLVVMTTLYTFASFGEWWEK